MIDTTYLLDVLSKINVICRDNGKTFTNVGRLNVIQSILDEAKSTYTREDGNLYRLYSKKRLSEINNQVLLISTHVDCEINITQCFSSITDNKDVLKGTYDNSITNAAIVYLMATDQLPENVLIAFTGDEERKSSGANEVIKKLADEEIDFKCISLDVTNQGWERNADFSIENEFWNDNYGKMVVKIASFVSPSWIFVPMNENNIPPYIPKDHLIPERAWGDESCKYSNNGIECFSLCLPIDGVMHSNVGILARLSSLEKYIECLLKLTNELSFDL